MAYNKLRIAKIVQETPDARSFVLEVPDDLADKYRYRAGQFLTFRVPHPEGAFNRCYSLSSAPETDGLPKVTVKRVDRRQGLQLVPRRAEGRRHAARCCRRPAASCWATATRPLLLFGGGSGITPMMSLIKSALKIGHAPHPAVLCQPRQALDHLRQGAARRCSPAHPRPAGGDPSSRRRAGPDQAGGDHGGDEGLRERRGLSVRPRPVHDAGREHAARAPACRARKCASSASRPRATTPCRSSRRKKAT